MEPKEIKEKVNKLIKETKDENIIKECGEILANLDTAQQELDDMNKKHTDLVTSYGKLVIQAGSKEKPDNPEEKEKPKTLDQIIAEELAKSSK